jgi:hypothetical protein
VPKAQFGQIARHPDLALRLNSTEQSENVYENKGTTPSSCSPCGLAWGIVRVAPARGRGTNVFSARGRPAEVRRIAKRTLFGGNKARKLLKINDITFWSLYNEARFDAKYAQRS